MKKYILFFLFSFFFVENIFGELILPFPDTETARTQPDSTLPPILTENSEQEISGQGQNAELVSNPEENTNVPEEVKVSETKQSNPEPIREKKTQLPNLTDRKEKKNGKKKEAADPSKAAFERGLARLRSGQKDAAKEEFSKAATTEGSYSSPAKLELSKLENSKAPESDGASGPEDDSKWKTSLESARSLRAQGKNSEAESILLRISTEADGEFKSRALLQLGDLLFRTGRYSDARSYLMDFWNKFGKSFPNAEDANSREYKRQREEKELGAYLLFKSSYKAGEGEWAKRFLKKYLSNSVSESQGVYSPLRTEMESFAKSDL
ncbi:tetratricopeptide repeat protein [Leptospira sarikeiensis]|uniref:Tetratricopeptide repeat protein n=1 Tax=Leptospira sarikeiensis TaxID=2484943 RepID=A0A4V3JR39_9LEPT|nr:tetratricopeptide repeat protein [Leptospira sarikeiensis]TGL58485.1 tetratricopeptide repeat protein [Leptospira sarikeiensis]